MRNGGVGAEALDEFLEQWQRLREAAAEPGSVVVVEGERDRRSLRRLGLASPVLLVHGGRTFAETAGWLVRHARRVIILTDWDTEGGHLAHRLAEFLEAEPLRVDLDTRRRLARIVRGELVHVEGLHGWARRLAESEGTPLELLLERAEAGARPTG